MPEQKPLAEPSKEHLYQFNPNDELLFYPGPLSREGSYDTLFKNDVAVEIKESRPLNNPRMRQQLNKLKSKRPWFLGIMTFIQVGFLLFSHWVNYQNTGSFIQTEPFNYMIGPAPGVFSI